MRGEPLMPTYPSKARKLLRDNKAKVIKRTPFTIQLTIPTGETSQPINLGVDAGSKIVGISATTEKDELYCSETQLRNDIVKLLANRKAYRNNRRNRKTRYRKARFLNRKKCGSWLAPSVRHKIDSHLKLVKEVHKILPISKIIVETASFDIQNIKNPDIQGKGYQQGEQLGFWNVREYVLFRDNHTCQHCKGSSKDKILNVHHIESRKTGSDSPNNLITLCSTCHKVYHDGKIELKARRGKSFRDAAFMGIMRWAFYDKLKELYNDVSMTYGYITKNKRIENNIAKTHATDAYCIANNLTANRNCVMLIQKFVRKNNRKLHKTTILKGGYRKLNQAPKHVFGFKLFDKVLADGKKWFIFARRMSGYFDLRDLGGNKLNKGSYSYKKINLLETSNTLLTEGIFI